jgi:hypothetical protein
MANLATSFAYVFAANAARGLPLTAQPLARLSVRPEKSGWDREPEQAREGAADGLNNRKRSADRRPRPDRP